MIEEAHQVTEDRVTPRAAEVGDPDAPVMGIMDVAAYLRCERDCAYTWVKDLSAYGLVGIPRGRRKVWLKESIVKALRAMEADFAEE